MATKSKINMNLKILIIGGHLTPALATIDELIKENVEIEFVGKTQTSISSDDKKEMDARGIRFWELQTGKVHRHSVRQAVRSMLLVPRGFLQAWKLLGKINPDGVLSFGGYLAVPVVWAAWARRIPVVIHEQTRQAGLANKVSAMTASKIALGFEESMRYFPQRKCVVIGNPVRMKVLEKGQEVDLGVKKPFIYVTGGHQGAQAINKAVFEGVDKLLNEYSLVHSVGVHEAMDDDWEMAQNLMGKYKGKYTAARYFNQDEVGEAMREARIIVSRAGANTCSEIAHLRKPCLLIPLPSGQNNEQLANAQLLEKLGLAKVISQSNLTSGTLVSEIGDMKSKLSQYKASEEEVKKLFPVDAAYKLAQLIIAVCRKE